MNFDLYPYKVNLRPLDPKSAVYDLLVIDNKKDYNQQKLLIHKRNQQEQRSFSLQQQNQNILNIPKLRSETPVLKHHKRGNIRLNQFGTVDLVNIPTFQPQTNSLLHTPSCEKFIHFPPQDLVQLENKVLETRLQSFIQADKTQQKVQFVPEQQILNPIVVEKSQVCIQNSPIASLNPSLRQKQQTTPDSPLLAVTDKELLSNSKLLNPNAHLKSPHEIKAQLIVNDIDRIFEEPKVASAGMKAIRALADISDILDDQKSKVKKSVHFSEPLPVQKSLRAQLFEQNEDVYRPPKRGMEDSQFQVKLDLDSQIKAANAEQLESTCQTRLANQQVDNQKQEVLDPKHLEVDSVAQYEAGQQVLTKPWEPHLAFQQQFIPQYPVSLDRILRNRKESAENIQKVKDLDQKLQVTDVALNGIQQVEQIEYLLQRHYVPQVQDFLSESMSGKRQLLQNIDKLVADPSAMTPKMEKILQDSVVSRGNAVYQNFKNDIGFRVTEDGEVQVLDKTPEEAAIERKMVEIKQQGGFLRNPEQNNALQEKQAENLLTLSQMQKSLNCEQQKRRQRINAMRTRHKTTECVERAQKMLKSNFFENHSFENEIDYCFVADYFQDLRNKIQDFTKIRRLKIDEFNDFRSFNKQKLLRFEGPIPMFRTFEKAVELYNLNSKGAVIEIEYSEVDNYDNGQFDILWRQHTAIQERELALLIVQQRISHLLNISVLVNKLSIYQKLKRYHFNNEHIMPLTYNLPSQFRSLCEYYNKQSDRSKVRLIIKPTNSSRGRDIFMSKDPLFQMPRTSAICQLYVNNPLLYQRHKFDFRVYLLIIYDQKGNIYAGQLYKHGICRICADPFDLDDIENLHRHLTNTSQNKTLDSDVPTRILLTELLQQQDIPGFWTKLKQICGIILSIVNDSEQIIKCCATFELIGFDVLFDADFRPWLLECNASPSLVCDCDLDWGLKPKLIADTIERLYGGENPQVWIDV